MERTKFLAVAVAVSLLLGIGTTGCAAASEDDQTEEAADAQSRAARITLANWKTHAAIKATDKNVQAIDAALVAGQFQKAAKNDLCGPGIIGEATREMWTDPRGTVRKYVTTAIESEDGASATTLYFNDRGALLFALFETMIPRTTSLDVRAYFDARGTRIWEVTREASWSAADAPDPASDLAPAPFRVTAAGQGIALHPLSVATNPRAAFALPAECD